MGLVWQGHDGEHNRDCSAICLKFYINQVKAIWLITTPCLTWRTALLPNPFGNLSLLTSMLLTEHLCLFRSMSRISWHKKKGSHQQAQPNKFPKAHKSRDFGMLSCSSGFFAFCIQCQCRCLFPVVYGTFHAPKDKA